MKRILLLIAILGTAFTSCKNNGTTYSNKLDDYSGNGASATGGSGKNAVVTKVTYVVYVSETDSIRSIKTGVTHKSVFRIAASDIGAIELEVDTNRDKKADVVFYVPAYYRTHYDIGDHVAFPTSNCIRALSKNERASTVEDQKLISF